MGIGIVKTIVCNCMGIPNWVCGVVRAIVPRMQKSLSDPDYIELIAILRRVRQAKHLSQRALSETLGRPQSFVAKYETCERRLDVLELLRICRALGIRLGDVLPEPWQGGV